MVNMAAKGESRYVKHNQRKKPYQAIQVSGIDDDMVQDAPILSEVLPKFFEFIGDNVLVGHILIYGVF